MKTLIAQRPGQYLVQTGPQRGRILDARGYHEEMFLQSLLARGYWEKTSVSVEEAERLLRQSIAKFDESKHPREPGGSSEGGQFTESGRTGSAESLPMLAAQAKTGIAAVEKLVPEAVKTADFSDYKGNWSTLSPEAQAETERRYKSSVRENVKSNLFTPEFDHQVWEDVRVNHQDRVQAEATRLTYERFSHILDPATIKSPPAGEAPNFESVRRKNGTAISREEQQSMVQVWNANLTPAWDVVIEWAKHTTPHALEYKKIVDAKVEERWQELTPENKVNIAQGYGIEGVGLVNAPPKAWTTGVVQGNVNEEDYARTRAVALRLTILRTDEIRKERAATTVKPTYTVEESPTSTEAKPNFVGKNSMGRVIAASNSLENATANAEAWAVEEMNKTLAMTSERIVEAVWGDWKRSSSSGLSLALQVAVAKEFYGVHRLTEEQMVEAHYFADSVGGMDTLQAYVRAQWEVTQTIMAKAGEDKLQVYRGLMLPGAEVDATKHQMVWKLGGEVDPPTNIKVVEATGEAADPSRVDFDFNGQSFRAVRHFARWSQLSPQQKANIKKVWEEEATDTAIYDGDFDMVPIMVQRQHMLDFQERGLVPLHYEPVEVSIQRRLDSYRESGEAPDIRVKLPELVLQRTGAASTTGTASVANSWGGVGGLPPDPTRVVMRLEVPPTSVLSLPVYGKNIHAEHESVIMGTRDRWLWDAWRNTAPEFGSQSIVSTIKKSEPKSKPLVIDMWKAEQGPHWLSGLRSQPPSVKTPTPPKK